MTTALLILVNKWSNNYIYFFFPTGYSFSFFGQSSLDLWKKEPYIKSINNPLDMKQFCNTVLYCSDWLTAWLFKWPVTDVNGTLVIST